MGEDGQLEKTGVPAALVSAYSQSLRHRADARHRLSDHVPVLDRHHEGKWGTLITNLLSFKRHYDANAKVADVLPELAATDPARYRKIGLRDLGDEMFEYLRVNQPGELLNRAYGTIPVPDLTPREAYQRIVTNEVELVSVENIANRTAANGDMPYPPGIPMLMSGENFGGEGIARRSAICAALQRGIRSFRASNM